MATLKKKPGLKKRAADKTTLKKKPSASSSGKKVKTVKVSAKQKKTGTAGRAGQKTGKGKKTTAARKMQRPPAAQLSVKRAVKGAELSQQDRLTSLKKILQQRKEIILKEAKQEISKYLSGENRQLVDTALDDGDWAVVDINEDISLRMLSAHRAILHDIDEAIRKIGEGTYGICEECGGEISSKRLSILPAAVYCIDCQENKEKLTGLIREETL